MQSAIAVGARTPVAAEANALCALRRSHNCLETRTDEATIAGG